MTACSLAFPCSVFDHPEGFMKLTKYLAYHTNGNIFTHNPSSFQALNQDARILDGMSLPLRSLQMNIIEVDITRPLRHRYQEVVADAFRSSHNRSCPHPVDS
jgi:hypothetical protein